MSYQVIARKWRPQTFEEVTGQEPITQTLRNAIEHDRLHHAYLFSGARGVGKTTTARLLAKALNCHKSDKPTINPCSINDENACPSCIEIAESRSMDVIEFDAASNTQVDKIRDLIIENIQISSARDRFKIFIIDEVHMLSNSSFNALLKTLEEPPPQVVFIMATTELHKLPETILSRCQEFEFRTIALSKILERLKLIAEVEKVNIGDDALREIARAGEGSMRDAQSAFDQVISFSGEKISVEDVTAALGVASSEMLTRIVSAIADEKPAEALNVVADLISRGHDLRNFCRDLLGHIRDLLVAKISGSEEMLESALMTADELRKQSESFSESDLTRFFHSLSETETKLRVANHPRYLLEIGLIKLIEMRRVTSVEKLLERLTKLEFAMQNGASIAPTPEKKTSKLDISPSEVPFPLSFEENADDSVAAVSAQVISKNEEVVFEPEPPELPVEKKQTFAAKIVESAAKTSEERIADLIANAPTTIDSDEVSDEFEHVEDPFLDAAYEQALFRDGDDKFKPAKSTVKTLKLPDFAPKEIPKIQNSNGNSVPVKSKFISPYDKPKQKIRTKNELIDQIKAEFEARDLEYEAQSFAEISKLLIEDDEMTLVFEKEFRHWRSTWELPECQETLREICRKIIGKEFKINVKVLGLGLHKMNLRPQNQPLESDEEVLWKEAESNPQVQTLISVFRGKLVDVTVENDE